MKNNIIYNKNMTTDTKKIATCFVVIFTFLQFSVAVSAKTIHSYKVVKGDSLSKISAKRSVYGTAYKWPLLYDVNCEKLDNPNLIYPGQILKINRSASPRLITATMAYARKCEQYHLVKRVNSIATINPLRSGNYNYRNSQNKTYVYKRQETRAVKYRRLKTGATKHNKNLPKTLLPRQQPRSISVAKKIVKIWSNYDKN
jgi:LysM repeat protein